MKDKVLARVAFLISAPDDGPGIVLALTRATVAAYTPSYDGRSRITCSQFGGEEGWNSPRLWALDTLEWYGLHGIRRPDWGAVLADASADANRLREEAEEGVRNGAGEGIIVELRRRAAATASAALLMAVAAQPPRMAATFVGQVLDLACEAAAGLRSEAHGRATKVLGIFPPRDERLGMNPLYEAEKILESAIGD